MALLTDLESDRVERKESTINSDRLSAAICAFANDMPGYGESGALFVGVSDNSVVLGRPITDELLRHLADLRDQGTILPPPTMTVRKLRVDGGEVAVVEVRPSVASPVRFKGRVYIRVGPRLDRPVQAYQRWIARFPVDFHRAVLGETAPPPEPDPYCLAQLKHYHSLMPLAQEARKPVFALKPADGAFGGHAQAAQRAYEDFRRLAMGILNASRASAAT